MIRKWTRLLIEYFDEKYGKRLFVMTQNQY